MQWQPLALSSLFFRYLFIAFCWQTKRRLAHNAHTHAREVPVGIWIRSLHNNLTTRAYCWALSGRSCVGDTLRLSHIKCAKYLFDKWIQRKSISIHLNMDFDSRFRLRSKLNHHQICAPRWRFHFFASAKQQKLSVSRDVVDLWYFSLINLDTN